jgi:hypothetical protein
MYIHRFRANVLRLGLGYKSPYGSQVGRSNYVQETGVALGSGRLTKVAKYVVDDEII